MKNKVRRNVTRMAAAVLAVSLGVSSTAWAESAAENAAASITTAITLAETDFSGNSATIRILIQQCVDSLEPGSSMAATLQSVLVLLDTGNADAASVTALLRAAVDAGTQSAAAETDPATAETQPTGTETDPAAETQVITLETDPAAGTETDPAATETQVITLETDPASETQAARTETDPASETQAAGTEIDPASETQAAGMETDPTAETQAADTDAGQNDASVLTGDESTDTSQTEEAYVSKYGLPIYEVSAYIKAVFDESMLVDVPGDWGNNASGRALTSYSPVNDSGAISVSAGTLTISYFDMETTDANEAFDTYEKNIADMSVTTALTSEDASAANLPARKIEFTMQVGANQFNCETICFAYEQTVYAIELMQGLQASYDYFPVYYDVVDSAEVGSPESIQAALAESQSESPAETQQSESPAETQQSESPAETQQSESPAETQQSESPAETAQSESPAETQQSESQVQTQTGDIGTFQYEINGHTYQFPTAVSAYVEGDIQLDRSLTLPYNYSSDADMTDGSSWTEIVNTEYYYLENSLYKEMVGVTNMYGYLVTMSEGIVTALLDTQGICMNITLPGGIHVGSAESDILNGFPEFAQTTMDGTAAFRGNELLYARNVRDDGCNGYVLIRNDAPYYSAVSIICENGIVKEICFECLGSVRADGVFL